MYNQRLKTPKTCEQCGTTFFPFRASTGQFCSNACKFQAKRCPVAITCAGCAIVFYKRTHKDGKYCTNECYQLTKKSRSLRERLYPFVHKTDYCWLWTGGINKNGYGRLYFQDAFHLAHRLMYKLEVGNVPDNLIVRHYECDNPPCVNPAHLRLGTMKDNSDDSVRKGRHAHGETSYAKLTEPQVIAIWHDTRTHAATGVAYNIGRRTVGHIKDGTTWKHLNLGKCPFRRYRQTTKKAESVSA